MALKNVHTNLAVPVGKAQERIKNAVSVYLQKDKDGNYIIPRINWKPLYLYGAPGIGKTAAAHQAAKELGIGFVSFSLTHHTRNSLLGLPVISELAGSKYTEYTMSEVIAKVVRAVEQGQPEGILLLDEFNCASDTVMPAMLEFLQTGNIGTHALPDGWVLILCGNPSEYNKSARAFDAAVMDRVRRIDVKAEYQDFAKYAEEKKLHPIVREYLDRNTNALYRVGEKNIPAASQNKYSMDPTSNLMKQVSSRKGENLEVVTPRGWENLSWALYGYEHAGFSVDEELVHEYLKSEQIAYEFYQFYWLNMQEFSMQTADLILHGEDMEEQAAKASQKTVAFRWKAVDFFVLFLEKLAADRVAADSAPADGANVGDERGTAPETAEQISDRISNAFRFLAMLPENEKLQESLLLRINASKNLMWVMMKVRNEEYLRLCGRSYGVMADRIVSG